MGIVNDIKDEFQALSRERLPWERYWREIAAYVLPSTQQFDTAVGGSLSDAVNAVALTPAATRRSKDLYDMTSLWAIERLTAGMISLKTPEGQTWHDIGVSSLFGATQTHDEDVALERLRDYLFRVRSMPASGFWPAHKAAVRSMCAFGDGWLLIEEVPGRAAKRPFHYRYLPLSELYPGVDPNRMFRLFGRTAEQLVAQFGDNMPEAVKRAAKDPAERHRSFKVLHAVRPREAANQNKIGVRGAAYESHYVLPTEDFHVGEGGFYDYPFARFAWNSEGARPYSEGPIACALGELRSLQEMAKNELIAVQTSIRPAYAVHGKNMQKINLNPSAVNQNLISAEGRPLFAPLNSGVRPDFAQSVMEARRNSVRELLYLNLWQIIIQDKSDTATEALIRAQEKGELLGPVGISMNEGLSTMVDREVGVLARKGAFNDDSPLAMPDGLRNADAEPIFTSPLDRLRRMSELIGMQRLVQFATLLSGGDPQTAAKLMARFDIDEMLDKAQQILGAPVSVLRDRKVVAQGEQQQDQMGQLQMLLQSLKGGGEAAKAVGEGTAAMAGGADQASQSDGMASLLQNFPNMQASVQGAVQGAAKQGAPILGMQQ